MAHFKAGHARSGCSEMCFLHALGLGFVLFWWYFLVFWGFFDSLLPKMHWREKRILADAGAELGLVARWLQRDLDSLRSHQREAVTPLCCLYLILGIRLPLDLWWQSWCKTMCVSSHCLFGGKTFCLAQMCVCMQRERFFFWLKKCIWCLKKTF